MSRQTEFFGKLCRDKVTGFVGVCTGRSIWLYGCDQYALTPRVDGDNTSELKNANWFDEGRIEVIEDAINIEDVQADKPGGEHDSSYYPSNSRM